MSLLDLALQSSLIQNAFIAALLASLVGGLMGTFVVIKRMAFFSGSIAHAILGGIGISVWLERKQHLMYISPLLGATLAALLAAALCSSLKKTKGDRIDAILTSLWTFGMSLGIIFISLTPGYTTDLSSYLIGNILWVSSAELFYLSCLLLGALCFILFNYRALQLSSFDPVEARVQGIDVVSLERKLLFLISLTIVALIQIVGVILVMSLLTLPQMVALGLFRKLSSVLIASCIISCFISCVGMQLALVCNFPVGATIACFSALLFAGQQLLPNCLKCR